MLTGVADTVRVILVHPNPDSDPIDPDPNIFKKSVNYLKKLSSKKFVLLYSEAVSF